MTALALRPHNAERRQSSINDPTQAHSWMRVLLPKRRRSSLSPKISQKRIEESTFFTRELTAKVPAVSAPLPSDHNSSPRSPPRNRVFSYSTSHYSPPDRVRSSSGFVSSLDSLLLLPFEIVVDLEHDDAASDISDYDDEEELPFPSSFDDSHQWPSDEEVSPLKALIPEPMPEPQEPEVFRQVPHLLNFLWDESEEREQPPTNHYISRGYLVNV